MSFSSSPPDHPPESERADLEPTVVASTDKDQFVSAAIVAPLSAGGLLRQVPSGTESAQEGRRPKGAGAAPPRDPGGGVRSARSLTDEEFYPDKHDSVLDTYY